MFKRNIKIAKDYFSLVKFKNKYLITFIIVDLINVLITLFIPYFTSLIVENITNKLYDVAFICVIMLGITYLINKIGSYCTNWCYANFFKGAYVEIHSALVNSIYNFDEEYSKKIPIGKIINSSNGDIINIAELPSLIFELSIEFIKLLIIYLVFAKQNVFVAVYVVVINLLYYHFSKKCNEKNAYYLKNQRNYADKITGMLSQILTGLKDIKSFGFSNKLNSKLDVYRKRWQESYFLKRKYYFTRKTVIELIIDFGKIILYFILIMLLMNNKMQISMFLLLISYYGKAKESINDIMSFDVSIMEECVSLYRINDIINYGKNTLKLDGVVNNDDIMGLVEFKNVSFKYDKLPTLKNISFVAKPNQVTAIVGKTGSGKTTIFNLLLRMYKVDSGKILIDNLNIYNYSKEVYNSNISVVNQKTFIFNMSIQANLSLVDSNKKRQIDACKRVGIHDFIMSLPDGYNTVLKEDATNISGGQKQLLSLARALLTTSEILLLDEITSSLDPNTTHKIINLLDDLKTDHTLIIITHNKDLMKVADKLIVLNNGKIECVGKHEDLIKDNNIYKQLNAITNH
jgi:ATP-binding cassette subfamily B protein